MHCPGHQKGNSPEAKGNGLADEMARHATLGPQLLTVTVLTESGKNIKTLNWEYDNEDLDLVQKLGADYDHPAIDGSTKERLSYL